MRKLFYILLITLFAPITIKAQITVFNTSDSLYAKGCYNEALSLLDSISNTVLCQSSVEARNLFIKAQTKTALCYYKLDMSEKGMEICKPLLTADISGNLRTELYEAYTINAITVVNQILASDISDYTEVRALIKDIEKYAEGDNLNTLHKHMQYTYIFDGYALLNAMHYKQAYDCLSKALTMSDDAYQRIYILKGIAEAQKEIGIYDDKLKAYEQLGNLSQQYGNDRNLYESLIQCCKITREYNDMERYSRYSSVLDSLVSVTTDPSALSEYYKDLASEMLSLNDYVNSEHYLNRYREIVEKDTYSPSSKNKMLQYYSYMRDLMRNQEKHEEALKYSNTLIEEYAAKYAEDVYIRYIPYLIHTQIYIDLKDSVNFERCCNTLSQVDRYMPGAFFRSHIRNYRGLGYATFGNYSKALEAFNESDTILAGEYPITSIYRINLLQLRASIFLKMNNLPAAYAEYKKYEEICKTTYGEKSQSYCLALYYLAEVASAMGNMDESVHLYSYSMTIMNEILHNQLRYIPVTDREIYIKRFTEQLWKMSSMALHFKTIDKSFLKLCYNTILILKSLIFESDRSMYNTLQAEGTAEDVNDFINMTASRSRLESLYKDYDNNEAQIDSIRNVLSALDNKLTLKSQSYKNYTSFLDYTDDDVRKTLKKKDVLFDYFDYDTPDGDHQYVVYVIKANNSTPIIIDAFLSSDIDKLLDGADYDALYKKELSTRVMDIFWNKLSKYATEGANVYYVPSGLMYRVSLESLPMTDGSILGEHYDIIRLSSAHELRKKEEKTIDNKRAVLYGGLRYDMNEEEMSAESRKFSNTPLLSMRSCVNGTKKFEYLPGSLSETDKISKILTTNGYEVKYYSECEGTEESFLTMHRNSPSILHIATHGFYYSPPAQAANNLYLSGNSNAMHLSGLVFSGANAAWLGKQLPQGVLGGILSASNISCLDLSNVSIAVLSTCQSGVGKVTRDGVFGLQRAFKKAGVDTIVLTLWDVSDKVTSEFMVEFYSNLFKGKSLSNKEKAFIKAKRYIRSKYPEPHYWAGFVMVD